MNMEGVIIIIIIVGGYFLPTMIGWKKKNRTAIFALNLFLGWTLLGWVLCLVWSLTKD